MRRILTLPIVLLLAVPVAGCPKKSSEDSSKSESSDKKGKDKSKSKGDDDKGKGKNKKGADDDGDKPAKSAAGDDDDDKTKPKSLGSGCKLPNLVDGDFTVTKGCKVKLTDNVEVKNGATLTIEKGATLSFAENRALFVEESKLVAQGTDDDPITFTSSDDSPNPGDWTGIAMSKPKGGTILDHVVVQYAGHDGNYGVGGLTFYDEASPGRVTVTNSSFHDNLMAGVAVKDGLDVALFAKFEGNTFKNNAKVAMTAEGNVYSTVGKNTFAEPVHVNGEKPVDKTQSWPALDVPWVVDHNFAIGAEKDQPILTLPDGATVKMAEGVYFWVGDKGGGGLVAKNVTFTSALADADAGDWVGLVFGEHVTGTTIDGCTIEDAGHAGNYGEAAITFHEVTAQKASKHVTITNTTIKNSSSGGIYSSDKDCAGYDDDKTGNKIDKAKLCDTGS